MHSDFKCHFQAWHCWRHILVVALKMSLWLSRLWRIVCVRIMKLNSLSNIFSYFKNMQMKCKCTNREKYNGNWSEFLEKCLCLCFVMSPTGFCDIRNGRQTVIPLTCGLYCLRFPRNNPGGRIALQRQSKYLGHSRRIHNSIRSESIVRIHRSLGSLLAFFLVLLRKDATKTNNWKL